MSGGRHDSPRPDPAATTDNEVVACIGLGANLGDRAASLRQAVQRLAATDGIDLVAVSGLYETSPVGSAEQPPYLNAAIVVRTTLTARAVLDRCLAIERAMGRDRHAEVRWGPRRIDLDVLLYDDAVIDEPGLTVPHPRLHERAFVLAPLAEIAPRIVHPVLGATLESLRDRVLAGAGPEYGRRVCGFSP